MTHDEMIAVITAEKEGKVIEQLNYVRNTWSIKPASQPFNFCAHGYRIKPEPREWWIGILTDNSTVLFKSEERVKTSIIACKEIVHVREVPE